MTVWGVSNVEAVNLGKSTSKIDTGIGFFNHMLDQFYSHAQVGVGVTVMSSSSSSSIIVDDVVNRHGLCLSAEEQKDLSYQVGLALGNEFYTSLLSSLPKKSTTSNNGGKEEGRKSVFSCPLDEALVTCTLEYSDNNSSSSSVIGKVECDLKPYGNFPAKKGRSRIGQWQTCAVESFIQGLAETSKLNIRLQKIRGDNAHHIVESSFKSLARALRNLLDETSCDNKKGDTPPSFYQRAPVPRTAQVKRNTKETNIDLTLNLDNPSSSPNVISSGLNTLDRFLECLVQEAGFGLQLQCNGDTYVDEHHSVEDVCIAIGQCLNRSLGTKAGLCRMWSSYDTDTNIQAILDLSNRPCLLQNLSFGDTEFVGDVSVEMLLHALESLVMNAHVTLHLVSPTTTNNQPMDTWLGVAKALGQTLKYCTSIDTRRGGKTASSKGTLSV